METFAKRLKFARKERGISQDELAEKSGVAQPVISKIERGLINQTRSLVDLAMALKVSPYWLEKGHGDMEDESFAALMDAVGDAKPQTDSPAPHPGTASPTGMEIALLYDLIPVSDRLRRVKAYNAATQAILAVLEDTTATGSGAADS